MTQRYLRKMFHPEINPLRKELDVALEVVDVQAGVIARQRAHIKNLDARIEKLQWEADGLRDLF